MRAKLDIHAMRMMLLTVTNNKYIQIKFILSIIQLYKLFRAKAKTNAINHNVLICKLINKNCKNDQVSGYIRLVRQRGSNLSKYHKRNEHNKTI